MGAENTGGLIVIGGNYIFQRIVSPGVKRVYHTVDPKTGAAKCLRKIKDAVVVMNAPSNRTPCRHCFGGKRSG